MGIALELASFPDCTVVSLARSISCPQTHRLAVPPCVIVPRLDRNTPCHLLLLSLRSHSARISSHACSLRGRFPRSRVAGAPKAESHRTARTMRQVIGYVLRRANEQVDAGSIIRRGGGCRCICQGRRSGQLGRSPLELGSKCGVLSSPGHAATSTPFLTCRAVGASSLGRILAQARKPGGVCRGWAAGDWDQQTISHRHASS